MAFLRDEQDVSNRRLHKYALFRRSKKASMKSRGGDCINESPLFTDIVRNAALNHPYNT